MTNKIYDFLPAHLRNKELETIFEATIERMFSKGSTEKIKSFVGRREKGIYSENDSYLSFPEHLFQRDNYGLEPVFSNKNLNDHIYYDDLLNSLYNKGCLVNDHKRLFKTKTETINLPIDADKFINFALYYWVKPGFLPDHNGVAQGGYDKHYVTIEKTRTDNNWWSNNNWWYHYDDIRDLITDSNKHLISQAQRPIIEFDSRLDVSEEQSGAAITEWEVPKFKLFDPELYDADYPEQSYIEDATIFRYVEDAAFPIDNELGFRPKVRSGDYLSEFVFEIDMPINLVYRNGLSWTDLYIDCEFEYRNLRVESGQGEFEEIVLPQEALSADYIDVYVDGVKKIGGYTYEDGKVVFENDVIGYVYVDYVTKDTVFLDGDETWQRINPIIEYNIDNKYHNYEELPYTTLYEHFHRLIETTPGLTGEANASNNFRKLSPDKDAFNKYGSVIVKNTVDIKRAYFAMTRDDYNPIESLEFIATSFQGYKDKLTTVIREILNDAGSETKSDDEILTTAIREIASLKRANIDVFVGSNMLNIGDELSHYISGSVEITDLEAGLDQMELPETLKNEVSDYTLLYLFRNGELLKNGIDYEPSEAVNHIKLNTFKTQTGDVFTLRYYIKNEETFIPPSAVKLQLAPYYIPRIIHDNNYSGPYRFILGHDGSMIRTFDDRTDDILLRFELMIFNKLEKTVHTTDIEMQNYALYRKANPDYTFSEKKYMMYPFFRRWMVRNNIDNLYNTNFNPDDWKTWNYRGIDDDAPGHWRGIHDYLYGTDNIFEQPWVAVGKSVNDGSFVEPFNTYAFWSTLKETYNATWPIPVNENDEVKTPNELLFQNQLTYDDISLMNQDWEFGDGSPVEMAWRRTSEYPFYEFIMSILTRPFEILDTYKNEVHNVIKYYHRREGINTDSILSTIGGYEFKLGSKLGGFVNNFKLMSENSALSNSNTTVIPKDNYDLFVHAGEPNRSENFSAIVIEKVSLDEAYPVYSIDTVSNYSVGDITYNSNDGKYYRRKSATLTDKEIAQSIRFDYSAWVLISQPETRTYGYRIHGYDDVNPVFYTLDWDRSSDTKVWNSAGENANLKDWQTDNYYRVDSYIRYQGNPYVCLADHTSSSIFDNDLENWKILNQWPKVNQISAYGYSETSIDTVRTYNYGDVLTTLDEVAHLLLGYQDYLKVVGWDFTDIADGGETVDYESLLYKFLEWSVEKHEPGEFMIVTPILTSGRFKVPYGIASVAKDKNKNSHRVVDSAGRKIPENQISFYHDIDGISWTSEQPIYGMKIDILDVEHAFVVDREDSYGDVIYDPLNHNRNLRMIVECNRTTDWDGTMAVDGYIPYGNSLVPNLETITEETRYYRDTLVDHSLEDINKIKSAQIGYTPRTYLTNHQLERESQLEFYKGFLAHKGTNRSVNRIVNNNSDFSDIKHSDIWAFKMSEYGPRGGKRTAYKDIDVSDIVTDPHSVSFTDEDGSSNVFNLRHFNTLKQIRTVGYVDSKDVNYIVRNTDILENSTKAFYEGDTAWVRFDDLRDWDVLRMSEIAEIFYVSETEDSQLSIALTNEIEIDKPVYLKINNVNIDPEISGYYNIVDDGSKVVDGTTVYEYLIFDLDYEPLIVEIDSSTSSSVYVPTNESVGVEAVGSVSNPVFIEGEKIVIEDIEYEFTATGGGTGDFVIGENSSPDPIISVGEQGRIVLYDRNGSILNTNTVITFGGTALLGTTSLTSQIGDVIEIAGQQLTIAASNTATIKATSGLSESGQLDTGLELAVTVDGTTESYEVEDILITGSVQNPELLSAGTITINGKTFRFDMPPVTPVADDTQIFNNQATPVNSVTLVGDMSNYIPGDITVNDGVDVYTIQPSGYNYNSSTGVITFNSPIQDAQVSVDDDGDPLTPDVLQDEDGFVSITVALEGQDIVNPITAQMMIDEINDQGLPLSASLTANNEIQLEVASEELEMSGFPLIAMGLDDNGDFKTSKLRLLAEKIDTANNNVDSYINPEGYLVLTTLESTMQLGGTAINVLDFDNVDWEATSDPTVQSVVDQIESLNIQGIETDTSAGKIQIFANSSTLTISEVTPGALLRLGYVSPTGDGTITTNSIDSIADTMNAVLSGVSGTTVNVDQNTRRISITTNASTVVISNVNGNPWDDLGIPTGTYKNASTVSNTMVAMRDIINNAGNGITVSLSSDGRMIFSSNDINMSFTGTSPSVLEKIGLYENYTSATSNNNFKIMRWKSVRWTPYFNGKDFTEFKNIIALNNQTSLIWVDEYNLTDENGDTYKGWAVLQKNSIGDFFIKHQQAKTVDTDLVHRMMITDKAGTWWQYQLFDPLNMKFPGDIIRDIDYVTWNDPAKYDEYLSDGLWLDEKLGEVWWDTNKARYYRYNDYGDELGNIDEEYVKRHWGKQVPGSEIVIKQWVSNETLPRGIKWFNVKKEWDSTRNTTVTKYYYWTTLGSLPRFNKKYSIEEIRSMLSSGGNIKNKFLPINKDTVLVSNNIEVFEKNNIRLEVQYSKTARDKNKKSHSDWKLMSKDHTTPIERVFLNDLRDSISGAKVKEYLQYKVKDADLTNLGFVLDFATLMTPPTDPNEIDYSESVLTPWIENKDISNIVVSVNHEFVNALSINIVGTELEIYNSFDIREDDIVRVYYVEDYRNWFTNIDSARNTFSSVVNEHLQNQLLIAKYPFYSDFIVPDQFAINSGTWFIDEQYKEIEKYQYLSKNRNIDMISLFEKGLRSFKIELEDSDEYYFEYRGSLRMVHKTNASFKLLYSDYVYPDRLNDDSNEVFNNKYQAYYNNVVAIQTHELLEMFYEYSDDKFIKKLFYEMVEYMYTEKTYPDWLFKTSYIDLTLMNKPLRQFAIYQRDTMQDSIDYINETKPYHTKIRKIDRIYPLSENVAATVDIDERINLHLDFGKNSRYDIDITDAGIEPDTDHDHKINDKNNDLFVDSSEWGSIDQGALLAKQIKSTNYEGGFDTGEFECRTQEASIVRMYQYKTSNKTSIDEITFFVYDKFGRGYRMTVGKTGTVDSFDGETVVVNQASYFKQAKDETKQLIAIENQSGEVEFMMYDSKSGSSLNISERKLYNGISCAISEGDKVYTIKTTQRVYDLEETVN